MKDICKWVAFVFILSLRSLMGYGQDTLFTYESFINQVLEVHPIAQQTELMKEEANLYLSKARGSFDPILSSGYDQKQFEGKNYYQVNDNQIKIPTLFGAEIIGGYELNNGVFLNPENSVPENGLAYTGVSFNLGKGLFIDERRRDLALAKNNIAITEANRYALLNDLVMNATTTYWAWVYYWQQKNIYQEALTIALQRFGDLKMIFKQGDIPAIDTLEASIQVQARQIMLKEAQANHWKAYYELSNYLWVDPDRQADFSCCPRPGDVISDNSLNDLAWSDLSFMKTLIASQHPEIKAYDQKLEGLQIERQWYAEQLKPQINLKYNILNEPVDGDVFDGYHINDYKLGVTFKMPLILRKERADLQLIKLKQTSTLLTRTQKLAELNNKFEAYFYELNTLKDQLDDVERNLNFSERLLEAEKIKFEQGESSMFLINSREIQVINYKLKKAELQSKILKTKAKLYWASGQLKLF